MPNIDKLLIGVLKEAAEYARDRTLSTVQLRLTPDGVKAEVRSKVSCESLVSWLEIETARCPLDLIKASIDGLVAVISE